MSSMCLPRCNSLMILLRSPTSPATLAKHPRLSQTPYFILVEELALKGLYINQCIENQCG